MRRHKAPAMCDPPEQVIQPATTHVNQDTDSIKRRIQDRLFIRRHLSFTQPKPPGLMRQDVPSPVNDGDGSSQKLQIENEAREKLAAQMLARLELIFFRFGAAGVPNAEQGRLSQEDLIGLLKILGEGIDERGLFHVARAAWLVRHARDSGLDLETILGK